MFVPYFHNPSLNCLLLIMLCKHRHAISHKGDFLLVFQNGRIFIDYQKKEQTTIWIFPFRFIRNTEIINFIYLPTHLISFYIVLYRNITFLCSQTWQNSLRAEYTPCHYVRFLPAHSFSSQTLYYIITSELQGICANGTKNLHSRFTQMHQLYLASFASLLSS